MQADNIIFLGFADNKTPEFKEVQSKDWVLFGENNLFPDHLLYLYNKSSNHNAIINGKAIYIFGNGFENGNVKCNDTETINDILKKCIIDVEMFGGCRIEVIWKMGGGVELRHLPFQCIRRGKEKTGYWYHKDWSKVGYKREKPVFIPDFDFSNKKGVQVFAYDEYRPGVDTYPLPGYFGALNDIETDVEISKYNLSVIKNGMFSSKMIVFNNGEPTKEIKQQIEKDFKRKFAGSENSGNFMLVFNTDPAKAPTVQDLSTTDLDKLFDQLNKTTQSEIFSGHLVTSPMLFGVKEAGQLGGRNEILEAFEIFKNTYINNKQKAIGKFTKELFILFNVEPGKILGIEPISQVTITNELISQNMTSEEIRERLGLPVIDKTTTVQADKTIQAIASLSPLVANKVLESMTEDEIRSLAALPPKVAEVTPTATSDVPVNENLRNMTGRQFQHLTRLVNKYRQGKLSLTEAQLLLRNSYGLTDDDITTLLSDQQFSEQPTEQDAIDMFSLCGESSDDYIIVKHLSFEANEKQLFADLTQIDSDIVHQIKKNKRAKAEDIAAVTKASVSYVQRRINELVQKGVLINDVKKIGTDKIIETSVNPETIDYRPKPETVNVSVKYKYIKRPGVDGKAVIETTRPFCKHLIENPKLYTMAEIETMSRRLGYSVFDRGGGFWGDSPTCRHTWERVLVIKKNK